MANSDDKMLEVFKETDAMYTGGRSPEALAILRKYSQLENAEVLWRLVRACSTVGMHFTKDQAEAKRLAGEAMDFGKRAIAADAGNYNAHRSMGVALSWYSDLEGAKVKIENSYTIRDHFLALTHFLKAEEVKPGFYVANWTWTGKTYQQLGKKAEAREWLTKAKNFTTTDPKDLEAVKEAAALLGKL